MPNKPPNDCLALTIPEVSAVAGCCRDKVYDLIRRGDLRARKLGRRTVILRADLEEFLRDLPELRLPE